MRYSLGVAVGAGPALDRVAVPADVFDDPRMQISSGVLGPGDAVGPQRSWAEREAVWIVLDPGVDTIGAAGRNRRDGPGVLAGFSGTTHGLANPGDGPIRYIRVAMGRDVAEVDPSTSQASRAPEWEPLDRSLLLATQAHGGLGEIRFRRLWDHDRFATGWGFVDHAVVDSATSVGYHRHETVQECYLILAGTGVMKVDDEAFDVDPGDCIPNHLGGAHGIVAPGEPVEFINVALYTEGRFEATDLGDDLADCLA
jgi:mannose-6-phosphate isomerase-like protein (cupin superfamily)